MIGKLRRAFLDLRAMRLIRHARGDVEMIWVVVGGSFDDPCSTGWECNLFQGRARHFDEDPALAIIGAFRGFERGK